MRGTLRKRCVAVLTVGFALVAGAAPAGAGTSAQGAKDPIVIGLYVPTENPLFTAPEAIAATQAGVKYVNNELDGVDGRKFKLEVCETRNTTETMLACANELAQKKPVAVIGAPDLNATAALNTVFKPQGIPVIGGLTFIPTEFFGPEPVYRTLFNGGAGALFAGIADFAVNELNAKKIVDVTVDSPAAQQTLAAYLNPVLKKAGLGNVALITTPLSTADLTPSFQAAVSQGPDVIISQGLACIPVLRAYQATGTKVPLVQPANCADPDTLKEAGDLANGKYYVFLEKNEQLDPKDKDVKVYVKAIKKYAKGAENTTTDSAGSAFAAVMNLRALMLELDGNVTAASVLAAVRGTTDQPNFLGFGPYSCTKPPTTFFPGICASYAKVAQVKNGKLKYVTKTPLEPGLLINP